jgi:carboxyl-terminal processing protease
MSTETVTLTREIVKVRTALGFRRLDDDSWDYMLSPEKGIGYIRVTQFSRNTVEELTEALDKLKSLDVKGLVLDLRNNPGGLLSSAIEASDLFVSEGRIVSTEGRNTARPPWNARKAGTYEGFPMAVLVNHRSASASEIVAACLQDHDRAVVVGERTWGKGSVQNIIELEDGRSALKLTTAGYKRPSGAKIHRFPDSEDKDEWGVTPNEGYGVTLSAEEAKQLDEFQEAVFLVRSKVAGNGGAEERPLKPYIDSQLEKALGYLDVQFAKTNGSSDKSKKPSDQAEKQADQRRPDAAENIKPA